ADILGCEDHHPPYDKERILAALDHAREPVKRRIWIRAAQRLYESGHRVVMEVGLLVVVRPPVLQRLFHVFGGDLTPGFAVSRCGRYFKRRQSGSRISVGALKEQLAGGAGKCDAELAKAALGIAQRSVDHAGEFRLIERTESDDPHPAEQWSDHFERRILRRRADQRDSAVFDVWKKHILLGFVEAMNLVH